LSAMPRLTDAAQLIELSESLKNEYQAKQAEETILTIGMGTCGLAAGAGETYQAVQRELAKRNLSARVRSVGCIGMCVKEPLLDVQLPGQPRITYANVTPARVVRIIEEHMVNGQVVHEWAVGAVPTDW
jgi:NADP-reducing hydrogenase subunit HndB